jgi:16S rRNA (adenine1518-N6/adenine1519-N6)-dimethyltransferase
MHYAPDEIATGGFFKIEDITEWISARPDDFATGFIECFRVWQTSHPRI